MATLSEKKVAQSPFDQFKEWFDEVLQSDVKEPTAMILATSTKDGVPSARTVLLKDYDEEGMVFFTNYQSRKGQELMENPKAALLFYWGDFERQIRIEGVVEEVDDATSDKYFASRPKKSRISAIASPQSQTIEKDVLDKKVSELKERYKGKEEVPRPPFWGGYRLKPHYFEFWQGRADRLHDRVIYKKSEQNWKVYRIAP